MARRTYSAYSLLIYDEYGVSPRTRARLRNRAYNVTPEEVDAILRANGKEDGDRASRKRMADIRVYIDGISRAREAYSIERSYDLDPHHYNPEGFSSSDEYFGTKAWVDAQDMVWIPLVDGDKWEKYVGGIAA